MYQQQQFMINTDILVHVNYTWYFKDFGTKIACFKIYKEFNTSQIYNHVNSTLLSIKIMFWKYIFQILLGT